MARETKTLAPVFLGIVLVATLLTASCAHENHDHGDGAASNSTATTTTTGSATTTMVATNAPPTAGPSGGAATVASSTSTSPTTDKSSGATTVKSSGATTVPSLTTTASSSSSTCFPASAVVVTPSGPKQMSDVSIGDLVQVSTDGTYSPVFMFTHKIAPGTPSSRFHFINIRTQSGASLTLSAGHFLYSNGQLAPASSVSVGDALETSASDADVVVRTQAVTEAGLYNPQTVHGDIVVNGVRASTYTTAVKPVIAHVALAPFRAMYSLFGIHVSALEGGADAIASSMPGVLQG